MLVSELEKTIDFMILNKEGKFNQFKGFSDFEVSKVQRLIDWVNSEPEFDVDTAKTDFYLFFSQHDERRGTNFLNTFPELENFWNECKTNG
jgi:hypothetical protein